MMLDSHRVRCLTYHGISHGYFFLVSCNVGHYERYGSVMALTVLGLLFGFADRWNTDEITDPKELPDVRPRASQLDNECSILDQRRK